jgi:hypothetical protein
MRANINLAGDFDARFACCRPDPAVDHIAGVVREKVEPAAAAPAAAVPADWQSFDAFIESRFKADPSFGVVRPT